MRLCEEASDEAIPSAGCQCFTAIVRMLFEVSKGGRMFGDYEPTLPKNKKPTDWSQVALWVVSIAAIVVVALDVLVWRA